MTIQEFESKLKVGLSGDIKVISKHTNFAPEGEEPLMGWEVYTYWTGLEGDIIGIESDITDFILGKLSEKAVDCVIKLLQSAKERYDSLLPPETQLPEDTLDPLRDILCNTIIRQR